MRAWFSLIVLVGLGIRCVAAGPSMDPHATTLPIYALPATAAADGDLSEWKGVPGVGPERFKYYDRPETITPSAAFAPSLYAGRVSGSPDLYFLVIVKSRWVMCEERAGWIFGSYLELFLDFGRQAREKADPEWWKKTTWTQAPEMCQFGFSPRTMAAEGKIYRSGTSKDWNVDYASVPVVGGIAYEMRVDGKKILDALHMTELPPVIGIDLGMMSVDYPIILEGANWSNTRGFFRLFGDWTSHVYPNQYGGLSTVPVVPPAGEVPAQALPALYNDRTLLADLRADMVHRSADRLADQLYWAACRGIKLDLPFERACMASASPRLREVCLAVLTLPGQDVTARKEAIRTTYLRAAESTPQALVLANRLNEQMKLGCGADLVRLLSHPDYTVATTAASALGMAGSAADLAPACSALTAIANANGKDPATQTHAAIARVFLQPGIDMLTFRVHPPPLPHRVSTRTVLARNTDLSRVFAPDNNTVYNGSRLLRAWPASGPRELWRFQVGSGWSATIETGGSAFVMGSRDGKQFAYCLDATTGMLKWQHLLVPHAANYGAASPVVDGDRVYFVAEGAVLCLRITDGSEVWREEQTYTGHAFASPLIIGDTLFLPGRALIAVDKMTGKVRWQTPGPEISPASLAYQELDGIPQIVAAVGSGPAAEVWGISARDGTIFWKYPIKINFGLCASPVIDGSRVLLTSGEPKQEFFTALQMFVVDGKIQALPVYTTIDTQCNQAHTPTIWHGAAYGFSSNALDCTDPLTGKLLWRHKGEGWNFNQQLIIADGLIFAVSGQELALADASPKGYRLLGRTTVPVRLTQQQPTLANGRLYLRGEQWVLCYAVGAM